ncbi:uncharacterized protein LOC131936427 [Physella acuta]|uniref:uncharacterized protein LOC131936427 n=1 Tax=Physella acuta TaxID=109671 RepID=UPI0027DCED7A|nr:uncharacterized protein LOC131936427 [Physella acuta]
MDVGREFSSWDTFHTALEQYSRENEIAYIVGTCKSVEAANSNEALKQKFPTKFKYCFARLICKHYGNYSRNSAGHHPLQKACKTGCTSSILVSVNKKRSALVIKEANLEHTHQVSDLVYSKHSENQRLQGEDRRMASVLLRAGVPLFKVQHFISNSSSQVTADINIDRIKNVMKGSSFEKEGTEFAFLADLDQLMAEDMECIVEIVNFDLVPSAVYIQTSGMLERMKLLHSGLLQIVTHNIGDGKMSLVSAVGVDSDLNTHTVAFCVILSDAETCFKCFIEIFLRNNPSFCDSIKGVVLDCSQGNAEFLQQFIPQASIAWSRSYILEKFAGELKGSKDMSTLLNLYKEMMSADTVELYEMKMQELFLARPVKYSKEFLQTWDSCREQWVQYEIYSVDGLQHHKSAVEVDYINSLKAFIKPTMGLSEVIKVLLKFDRNEEPEEILKEHRLGEADPSCQLYKLFCFPKAWSAITCQISVALSSLYEITAHTDMIFVKRVDSDDQFILDTTGSKCSCQYFLNTDLPCEHIFAWLKFSNKPLYNESLVPVRWQVFGRSITLDSLAESLSHGSVPSSFHHDERLKELQVVLKDVLSLCCCHSYQQMEKDLILLKQVLTVMRNCTSHRTKLVTETDDQPKLLELKTSAPIPEPRKRGRPRKKNKHLQTKENNVLPPVVKPGPVLSVSGHNLRTNIKHKFVTREAHSGVVESGPAPVKKPRSSTGSAQNKTLGQDESLSSVKAKVDLGLNSVNGEEVKVNGTNNENFSDSLKVDISDAHDNGPESRDLYNKKKKSPGCNVNTSSQGWRPSALRNDSMQPNSDDEVSEEEDENDEEDDDEVASDKTEDSEGETMEVRLEREVQEVEAYLANISHDVLKEVMQVASLLESPEERAQKVKEGAAPSPDYPPDVLIRTCQSTEVVNTIMEHIKQVSPGFDQYPYKVSACLTYRAFQTDVPIRDLLQTLSFWPSHLPEFPNTRPIEGELALAEGQILRLGSYKLNQADMDTLRTGEEISVKVLHAYLEILAQRHSGKMFLIPFDVVHSWRSGNYSDRIFKKVHLKTFEYLVLPIHCGAEFTDQERQSGEIPAPCWMALVADVKKRTVAIMNPKTEDKYTIAANGYMLQWRRYMQIRSVHTGEMLSSWTSQFKECSKVDNNLNSGVHLLMNVEAVINNVPPVVMTQAHVQSYLQLVAVALRDTDRETTVLCVGGPECQVLAARDADWLQCENCRTWWHRACADQPASRPIFYCNSCHQRILAVKGKIMTGQQATESCYQPGEREEAEEPVDEENQEEQAGIDH